MGLPSLAGRWDEEASGAPGGSGSRATPAGLKEPADNRDPRLLEVEELSNRILVQL